MLKTTTVIKIILLNRNKLPSAERIAVFPIANGMAPSNTPCGQRYLQKNGSPIPMEFVTSIGSRMTNTIKMKYFRYLNGLSFAVENFLHGIL